VDPAAASLDVARGKPGADGVRWIHGDATTLPPLHVELARMTGNVAQVFLDDDDWLATLAGIRQALRPAGQLVFEVRRPERRAWQEWGGNGPVIKDLPGVGRVEQTFELTRVDLPFVSFRSEYTFASDGARITSESTLCFRTRDQIESDLDRTGFDLREVRDAPDRPGLEYVFIAVRR
jgi:SAM-dependent methyltransferase